MDSKSYILYGIKDSSKHIIDHSAKLRELVNTAEYILLKAKELHSVKYMMRKVLYGQPLQTC